MLSFAFICALFVHVSHLQHQLDQYKTRLNDYDIIQRPGMHVLQLKGDRAVEEKPELQYSLQKFQNIHPESVNNSAKHRKMILVYNRVPKTGSESIMLLLRDLAARNNFAFYKDRARMVEHVTLNESELENELQLIDSFQPPAVYVRHVCYINFTTFNKTQPLYINMVRDPVERVISWYHYVRASWYIVNRQKNFPKMPPPSVPWLRKDFETCVLNRDVECRYTEGTKVPGFAQLTHFFCGQENECRKFNTQAALQKAKENVERYYSVVGVLEELNVTLAVLEHYIPRFFRGARDLYWGEIKRFSKVNRNAFKPSIPERIKEMVRKNFTREIEFYKFCKRRLYKQYAALKLEA
ncbi:heparan sulfate 2-O-sulfotransferase pipe-like [Penaeus chinensis]|uniref:heparan sulfate 2-O-sulfotransferase pipe-like n=1 Tax=Penaeus chinensis TaxID=139456 RepID=UPI001FB6BEC2|nr:heparan sulfate 2-O-sulfotransferase pipe-like [Penaeus chinensis]